MRVILLSDAALFAAYEQTNGEPGNPDAERLLVELKHRGLDL